MPTFANATSVKEQVLTYLRTLVASISVASGYHTDIKSCQRYRVAPWEVGELPAATIVGVREDKTPIVGQPPRMNTILTCVIEGVMTQDPTDDTEEKQNLFLLDVEAALQVDITCGGVAREVTVVSTELELGFDDLPYGAPKLTVQVAYQQGRADPSKSY